MSPSDPPQAPPTLTNPSESEIYDRQIRLWGADAQSKMSSSKVLYINITGTSSEILKNLILAGIRGAVADGRPYPEALAQTPTSFIPPSERSATANGDGDANKSSEKDANEDDGENKESKENDHDGDINEPAKKRMKKMSVAKAMQPHILELNPLLEECEINEDDVPSIPSEYFTKFDIVIASKIGLKQATRISKATAVKGGKFYLVHSFGFYACALIDLGEGHTYRKEIGKDKLSDVMKLDPYLSLEDMVKKKLVDVKDRWHKNGPPVVFAKYRAILNYYESKNVYPKEESADDFVTATKVFLKDQGLGEDYLGDDDALKRLAITATAEISPVCAVMGGVLGNEAIKAISGKGEPANNMLLFDGIDGGCKSFALK